MLSNVKGLAICFYFGWSGSILQFRQNIIKVGSKSWLLTCSSLSLPSYTGSALRRELNFCNGYLSLLYFCTYTMVSLTCKFSKFVYSLTESFCICLLTSPAYTQYLSQRFEPWEILWNPSEGGVLIYPCHTHYIITIHTSYP